MNALLSAKQAAFRLGALVVEPSTGRISGPGGEVHLEPRLMAVLEALARTPGQIVMRAELLAEIWPGGEVYDEALTQCVYQLRQQLLSAGGDGAYRNLIATVPKRGYVLEGHIEPVVAASPATDPRQAPKRTKVLVAALSVVAVLIAAWAVFQWRGVTDPPPAVPGENTVAVLPFLPLVEDDREPVLELGIADTLITRMSGIGELVVRPMSSVRRYGDLERDSLAAGRQLGVNAVVDGSIQRTGDTLRVAVRLLRVADGAALWAETISEPFDNIFAVQDQICARVADALALELGQDERREMARGGTSNTEAYQRYLQGRYHLAWLTPEDLRKSVEYFREAVALDPNYAQAWLGLANVQFRIPIAGEVPPREYYPLARQAAEKALELDPGLAEGYAMLGWIEHWFEWDWAASEAHFKRAIEMNPNDTESHLGYAHLLSSTGQHQAAIEEVRRARELSPFYPVAAALEGGFLMRAGRTEEALLRMEEARPVGENFWLFHVTIAGAYAAAGRLDEALAELRRAREVSGDSTWAMANEIEMLVRMGRQPEAEFLFEEMMQRSSEQYVPPYDLAVAYRSLGELDLALAMLIRAYETRDPKMALMGIGGWKPISDRQEYRDLLQKMNLQVAME